ncbi:MAG: signal peptidase II [Spirochaetes bacterium]|nr:signal peptidase II [Spirochaetota bacterium]
MKKYIYSAVITAVTLTLDVITKYLVVQNIAEYERINVIGSFFQLTLLYNRGGLFGIFQGYQSFFLVLSIIVLCLIVAFFIYEKRKSYAFCTAMSFITAGAIGNILDRVTGKKGVVDFLYIGNDNVFRWPAFNVADALVVAGAVILFIVFMKEENKRKENK